MPCPRLRRGCGIAQTFGDGCSSDVGIVAMSMMFRSVQSCVGAVIVFVTMYVATSVDVACASRLSLVAWLWPVWLRLLLVQFEVLVCGCLGWGPFVVVVVVEHDVDAFVDVCRNGKLPPIPLEEIFEVSRATMRAAGKP